MEHRSSTSISTASNTDKTARLPAPNTSSPCSKSATAKNISQRLYWCALPYSNGAEWREMVGATLERSMYVLVANTSVEQDRALIAEFNSGPM